MKKVSILIMIAAVFYGCSSKQVNTDRALMDVAERSQSTDSILGQNDEKSSTPTAINNSNRSEVNKDEKTKL